MTEHNGIEIFSALEDLVHPQHTALLIYDMQAGIVRQVAEGPAILDKVLTLLEAGRRAGIRIVFTRHMSLPKEWMGSIQYRMAMAWQRRDNPADVSAPFLRDTPNFELTPELQPRSSEAIFDKLAMSAFEGTPLQFALRDAGIRSVLIAGIALEIGIEPTVRHATDLGFVPIVLADACGSGRAEAGARALETMRFVGEAVIGDVVGFASALGRRSA